MPYNKLSTWFFFPFLCSQKDNNTFPISWICLSYRKFDTVTNYNFNINLSSRLYFPGLVYYYWTAYKCSFLQRFTFSNYYKRNKMFPTRLAVKIVSRLWNPIKNIFLILIETYKLIVRRSYLNLILWRPFIYISYSLYLDSTDEWLSITSWWKTSLFKMFS